MKKYRQPGSWLVESALAFQKVQKMNV